LKDPEIEKLDDGWDDAPSDPPAAVAASAGPPEELDDLDAGWDDASSDAPPPALGREPAGRDGAVRPARMTKRERRAFEREKRMLGEKRRAERRADEKRERKEALRREGEERAAERRRTAEREEARRVAEAKRSSERRAARPRKSRGSERSAETQPKAETRSRRFVMPNGGWIIVVIGLVTLGTAWYAFGR
jgi:type IV secretory pathway VirB10-like protein